MTLRRLYLVVPFMALTLSAQIPDIGPCAPDAVLGSWALNANGHIGTLNITSIDATGKIVGTMIFPPLVRQIQGFWNASSCKIIFVQASSLAAAAPAEIQIYTGYAYNLRGVKRLAGSFEAFAGTGGSAGRHTYGWDALKP
jgi:hypothetical protein